MPGEAYWVVARIDGARTGGRVNDDGVMFCGTGLMALSRSMPPAAPS